MKNFLKQIVSFVVIAFLALAFVGYFLNYRTVGELSFCISETKVYSASDLHNRIYTLQPGDSFVALTNFDNNDSVKIRFENSESGDEEIGFIKLSNCYNYSFPLSDSSISTISKPTIVLSLKPTTTLDVFLEQFVRITEDYEIIGVYLEDSDYSEEKTNISVIRYFCDEQQIPYGLISTFNHNNVEKYLDSIVNNDTYFTDYNILPHVFNLDSIPDRYNFDKDLSSCIFQSAALRNDNIQRYWITSSTGNHNTSENSVMLVNLQEDSGITYCSVSVEFENELLESYRLIQCN